jgi:excisionase family DNA binding protein
MRLPVGSADDVLLFDNNLGDSSFTLLTISEVAEILKVSATTVRRLQQQRHIPFLKVGGSVRFLKQDVVSYLEQQRVEVIEY